VEGGHTNLKILSFPCYYITLPYITLLHYLRYTILLTTTTLFYYYYHYH
jgi:hypothetical protein